MKTKNYKKSRSYTEKEIQERANKLEELQNDLYVSNIEEDKKESITGKIAGIFFKVGLSGIKSFVFALSQIVWVFAGVLIIGVSILYLIKSGDIKTMTELPKGLGYLLDVFKNYWGWFFTGIWIFDFIINFKEINKD